MSLGLLQVILQIWTTVSKLKILEEFLSEIQIWTGGRFSSATPQIHYIRSQDPISNFAGERWSCFQPSDSSTFTERMGWPESDLSGNQRGFYNSFFIQTSFDFRSHFDLLKIHFSHFPLSAYTFSPVGIYLFPCRHIPFIPFRLKGIKKINL